jgi:carboxylesterase
MKKVLIFLFLAFVACNPVPKIDDATMMDGALISDVSLHEPEKFLVSAALPNPTEAQKDMPVIIAVHGYSASTFEWDEFREFADENGSFLVSQVLLGGHGVDYETFKMSSWKDWQQPIRDEYRRLRALGFKHISFAGSSTGATLIVNLFTSGFFEIFGSPDEIFLIDPIIIPRNKALALVGLLGPILGYTLTGLAEGEMGKWYFYRPQESLKQLHELITLTRGQLKEGITLTPGTRLKIFMADADDTVDPKSATLLHKGLRTADGAQVELQFIPTDLHVFTRLRGRNKVTQQHIDHQQATFKELTLRITQR